jgi:hypothetical protein
MGSTHNGRPSLWRAMIEDSTEDFLMASSGEMGSTLPSPTQAMTTVPPQMAAPRLEIGLPLEQWCTHQEGQRAQARAQQPSAEQELAQP